MELELGPGADSTTAGVGLIRQNGDSASLVESQHPPNSSRKHKGVLVTFEDVHYTVFPRKRCKTFPLQLLRGVSGAFKPGEMAALMGPSGSGKTTLLDVLAGRKTAGKVQGCIQYGGRKPDSSYLRRHTGYVEQFDTLVDNLTVREMFMYTAQMKLPVQMPLDEKTVQVDKLVQYLELGSCQHTRIGNQMTRGVSGGQAKRVNIGVSIITDPVVLFLDEPTSGLDSFTADEVMTFVQTLAHNGMTVCATIHSPSPTTYALFDRLMLLVGGRTVYFGPNREPVLEHFRASGLPGTEVPLLMGREAEWLVGLITGAGARGDGEMYADHFADSSLCSQERERWQAITADIMAHREREAAVENRKGSAQTLASNGSIDVFGKYDERKGRPTAVPSWYALRMLLQFRTLRNYSEGLFLSARIVDKAIVVGIMMSLFAGMGKGETIRDQQNIAAALFMWSSQPAFGCAAYLPTIMLERPLYKREHSDGLYYSWVYYTWKCIQEVVLAVPVSVLFCGLVWAALQLEGNFFLFWISFLITQLTAIGVAFCFATICPTLEFANGAVPSYCGTLLFFVGFLVPVQDIPPWWWWYSYTNYLHYGFSAMMLNTFRYQLIPFTSNGVTYNSIIQFYGLDQGPTAWGYVGIQVPFMLLFLVGAGVVLRFIHYGSR